MKNQIVFMYSGQGSQYKNMGLDLYQSEPVFQYWMNRLDKDFIKYTGNSIFDLLYGDRGKVESKLLVHTHLAIFMVEYSITQVLLNQGIYPDSVIGVSLGEFTASAVNEQISFKDCMEIIYNQALIITETCPKSKMISVLADSKIYSTDEELYENSELVSVNFKNNFTIALSNEKENIIKGFLNRNNIKYIYIPVEYGFHSSLIDKGESMYKEYLNKKNILVKEDMPYIQYSSALVNSLNRLSEDFFWNVVRKPTDFQNTIRNVIDPSKINLLVDLGPSGTLATSCRYIINNENVIPYTILSPYGGSNKNLSLFYRDIDSLIKI